VPIPEDKGVHTKIAGAKKEKYVYKYVKYYRNEDGKPRNKAKTIGKYDEQTGKMHPNQNYYQIYDVDDEMAEVEIMNYGYTYLITDISERIGLTECLIRAFGNRAMDIVAMAAYMIQEGNEMNGIDDWQGRNYVPLQERTLNSQTTSRIFGQIGVREQNIFFSEWIAKAFRGGSVFYDVTTISSYSKEITAVEWGYNRDGDDLPQFNIGMFCDKETKTALYYNMYNGSLTDKTNLSYVMANAKSVGMKEISMILDGGFWSEECFHSLREHSNTFTIGMPGTLKESEKIINTYGDGIDRYVNKLTNKHHIYCRQIETEIYGVSGRVFLYYDSYSHTRQCNEISERIDMLSKELSSLKRYPKEKLNRYKPYFQITKNKEDSGFRYEVEVEKVEKTRRNKGYFLLFSTDTELSADDILSYYRAKDADEKLFSQIKIDMDGNRVRTHSTETTDGKVFVTFVACLVRNYIMNKLANYMAADSTSLKKIFNQLSDIVVIKNDDRYRFTKALTKKQKNILLTFGLECDILTSLRSLSTEKE
jgi:transposase